MAVCGFTAGDFMIKKAVWSFSFIIAVLLLCGCSEKEFSDGGYYLDTFVSVTAYGENAEAAVKEVLKETERIENLMSAYKPGSDICRINSAMVSQAVEISEETASVLKKALEFSKKTDGAFDISVKPLVDLWNIKAENPVVPSETDISVALESVGYENILLSGNKISFLKENMKIDLGGAAKGYCADRAAEIMKKHGVENALLDFGGNIFALGKNKNGTPWRIGLQDPKKSRGEHFTVEELSNKTAVTSGSYERYFEYGGKIYHHILNPQTGYPADSGLISATVISKNSFEADMLSTAVFVLGVEDFSKIKDRFDFEKIITVDKNNNQRVITK